MITMQQLESRSEWLKHRKSYIGGSDAACIVGENPWKTNQELWEEKTGRRKPEDISDKPAVKYGTMAEEHLRELFKLDYPELRVDYVENNFWTNTEKPWAHASLDGWLTDQEGRLGILEIKTTTIQSAAQKAKWEEGIPQNYYCQILHYMMVTGAAFAILKAKIRWEIPGAEPFAMIKHYRIEREDVEADIEYLEEVEKEFAQLIEEDKEPALILPEI